MIEINLDMRPSTKSGAEVDAIDHRQELNWNRGEARYLKRAINRRFRREAREILRTARH